MEIGKMQEKLKKMLTPRRFAHCVGVMETAAELARAHGEDPERARVAGLLHDCAKNLPYDYMPDMCAQRGVVLDEMKRAQPGLIHADLGAALCRELFEVTDEDVCAAIANHTLGRERMSVLEKIVYLADCIEPNRKPSRELETLREIAYEDLNLAMRLGAEMALKRVRSRNRPVHPQSQRTLEYYEGLTERRGMELVRGKP
jgi:nicotinate-nucleotide adenylyltransferase